MLATWGCTTFPKPTLSLNFLGATSLDSGITFSRGSQATLFDSTGTLVYAKQNLLSYSEDFADATWSKDNATVNGNAAIAPNGTLTADKLITNAAVTNGQTFRNVTLAASTTFTFSCFAKAGEWSWTNLATRGPENLDIGAFFNLSAGTVGTVSAGVTASITPVGNGWYRCAVTRTTGTGAAASRQRIYSTNADNTLSTGDGTSGIFIWGAQLNQNPMEGGVTSSLTTYYPTTTAAYYAPRFDYNPSTLQPRGLLIEEQRTNLLLQSGWAGAVGGSPGTAPTSWTIGLGTGANTTLVNSIYGTAEQAIKFDADATERIWYNQLINVTNGVQYAMSVYIEAVSGSIGDSMLVTNGTATVTQNTFVINPSSPGRYTILFTATGTGTINVRFGIGTSTTVGGTCSVTMSRPQVEAGAFATSYIPTTTTALTRNADVASMTGTNFSSWYNASAGTIYAQSQIAANIGAAPSVAVSLDDTTLNNRMQLRRQNSTTVDFRFVSSSGNFTATLVSGTLTGVNKISAAYAASDQNVANNGTLFSGITPQATVPTITQLTIGNGPGSSYLNGWISRISYYPTRLPNATLQALTL